MISFSIFESYIRCLNWDNLEPTDRYNIVSYFNYASLFVNNNTHSTTPHTKQQQIQRNDTPAHNHNHNNNNNNNNNNNDRSNNSNRHKN